MEFIRRRPTRQIHIGSVPVGGTSPISVQTMTKVPTTDVPAVLAQIQELARAGCEIIRLAVLNADAAAALEEIKKHSPIPIVADIHFDWKLALTAIESGVNALRINPGNIGAKWKVQEVVNACKEHSVPIRIGVNAGSLHKDILQKYGHPTPEAIVESAQRHIEILDELGFDMIKVSLKASNVPTTVSAYELFSQKYDYPLHVGISEAGPSSSGIIKSAVGVGMLLSKGIGDTIRISLTDYPTEEIRVAYEILKSLELRQKGVNIISCPTCGRTRVNLVNLVKQAEGRLREVDRNITVAIMGCEVNGPGEAREADYGIASGSGEGLLFKKGTVIRKVKESDMLDCLMDIINEKQG